MSENWFAKGFGLSTGCLTGVVFVVFVIPTLFCCLSGILVNTAVDEPRTDAQPVEAEGRRDAPQRQPRPSNAENKSAESSTRVANKRTESGAPLIGYEVISREEFLQHKVSYDIRVELVNGRLPTADELAAISNHLIEKEKPHDRSFVLFYLPGMTPGSGAFATAHHPNMQVKINSFMVPERFRTPVTEESPTRKQRPVEGASASQTSNRRPPEQRPAQQDDVSAVTWEEVDGIYNLKSVVTRLKKDELWKSYKGKRVRWVGEVSEISKTLLGGLALQIKMNPDTLTSDLLIRLRTDQTPKALKLNQGERVVFSGGSG